MSETHKKIRHKGHFKKGHVPWSTGTKGLVKPNKGNFKKGQTPWNKGKIGLQPQTLETRQKRSRSMKGKNRGPKTIEARKKCQLQREVKNLQFNTEKTFQRV